MNTLTVLLQQIGMFVIYIITGVILIRTKVLTRENLEIISKVVIKLSLPVMIFINTVNGVDRQTFFSSLSILGIAAVMYVCLLILGTLSGKVFRLQGEHLQLYRAMTVFGNVGFMGIPIVVSIYPEKGMLYMAVFTVIDQLMLWTLGVKLTSSEKEGGAFNPKKLINPVTVAIILAMICVLIGIRIPLVLNTALQKMGATATPLAMIYLGGVFACIDVLSFIRKPDYYGITLIKMLVFPVLFYILLGFVHIPADIRMTMALTSAMPVMSSVVMMANVSGSDGDYAMGGIVVTTLCSVLTLPVVSWIFQVLG
ncbi:auxin efflux carrier [uncultured Blautia sp.]|nr:AEC family transporter [uncultured Blautia sp.]SCH99464.1 auxin efflux carrier [uncultured Blautia sp.]